MQHRLLAMHSIERKHILFTLNDFSMLLACLDFYFGLTRFNNLSYLEFLIYKCKFLLTKSIK